MAINTQWFKDRIADKRLSQRGLARLLGIDHGALSLTLRGKREMKMVEAAEIARLLGVPAEDVMENAGVRIQSGGSVLQIGGFVDGHGEVHCANDLGQVKHPGGDLPQAVDAVLCKTAGSSLDHMNGWLLFRAQAVAGVPADAVDRISLCKIKNGITYLAKPNRSLMRGRWDLTGPAMDAKAVELEYAAPVLLIST